MSNNPVDKILLETLNIEDPTEFKDAEEQTIDEVNKLLEEDGKEPIADISTFLSCDDKRLNGRTHKKYAVDVFERELLRADAFPDTFFAGSFSEYACAEDVHDLVLEIADKRIPRKQGEELVILPPLFIRSTKDGTLRFMIERHSESPPMIVRAAMEKAKHATIMLLFLEQGPIIPMVRVHEYETFKELATGWYQYTGETTPEIFARNFDE